MKKLSSRTIVVLTGLAAFICLIVYFSNAKSRLPCGHEELQWRIAFCEAGFLSSEQMGECLRVGDAVARWKETRNPADFDTIAQHLFRNATIDTMHAALGDPDWSVEKHEPATSGVSFNVPVRWFYAISETSITHITFDVSGRVSGFGSHQPQSAVEPKP